MTTSTAAEHAARSPVPPDALLRFALRLDAAITGLNAAAYVLAAPLLDDLLGLSAGLLRGTGAVLLVVAAGLWLVGTRPRPGAAAVRTVIVLNALWAAGSVVVVLTGAGTPTTVGAVWIVLQAVVVAALAGLQVAGLRRRS